MAAPASGKGYDALLGDAVGVIGRSLRILPGFGGCCRRTEMAVDSKVFRCTMLALGSVSVVFASRDSDDDDDDEGSINPRGILPMVIGLIMLSMGLSFLCMGRAYDLKRCRWYEKSSESGAFWSAHPPQVFHPFLSLGEKVHVPLPPFPALCAETL